MRTPHSPWTDHKPLSPWADFSRKLIQAERTLPNVYEGSIHLGDDGDDRIHKLEALDEALQEEIVTAIESYTGGNHWPQQIDPQTNELLRMRFRVALTFALQHIESDALGTPLTLPFPELVPMDLMRWFLIDWWQREGRLSYAQDRA